MLKPATAIGQENCKKTLQSIGQDLIDRAEDISRDLQYVSSITIYAQLNPTEIVNYDVSKNYQVFLNEEENNNGNEN